MRAFIIVASALALLLALAMAALGPGTRFGLWDYSTAFGWMRNYLSPPLLFGVVTPMFAAAILSALAFALALWKARGLAPFALIATIAAAGAGYAPVKMRDLALSNPVIHDVTTDFEHPPEIASGAGEARKNPPHYVGEEIAPRSEPPETVREAQTRAFPDIRPLVLDTDIGVAAAAAKRVISEMGMDILAEGPAGPEAGSGWRIEAVSTSFWYGFKDDFIVRIVSHEGGARIDVRSKSRVGQSDLGANAKRVRQFLSRLENEISQYKD